MEPADGFEPPTCRLLVTMVGLAPTFLIGLALRFYLNYMVKATALPTELRRHN